MSRKKQAKTQIDPKDPFAPFRKWGAQGGKARSKAKKLAARENGKRGGRPKGKG